MKQGWQGLIIKPIILYLGLKKVVFLEELSLWGGHAIKSFTASDAVIEELISFRLTHQILQILAETLSFWRLFFFESQTMQGY